MKALVAVLLLAATGPVDAQTPDLRTGEYIAEGGVGVLSISRAQGRSRAEFSIKTGGADGHSCHASGTISNGSASLAGTGAGKPCVLTFLRRGNDIEVKVREDGACHAHCGTRGAGLDGTYLKPNSGCETPAVKARRARFKSLYDARRYAEAVTSLQTILVACRPTLGQMDAAWIRNDLAIARFRSGDSGGCLDVLRPLSSEARKSDEEIREEYADRRHDLETYMPVVRATRTNLKLCERRR